MKTYNPVIFFFLCVALFSFGAVADVHKNVGSGDLLDPALYEEGRVPGPTDRIVWDSSTGNENITLSGPLSIAGIYATNLYHKTEISSDQVLTMGAEGLYKLNKGVLTFNLPVLLAADQTWYNTSADINFAKPLNFQGHTLTLTGSNRRNRTDFVGPGILCVQGGSLNLYNGGKIDPSLTVRVERNAAITLEKNDGKILTTGLRMGDVTLSGAGHYDGCYIGSESLEKQARTDEIGTVLAEPGYNFLRVNITKEYFTGLNPAAYQRVPGAFTFFRGTQLGQNPIADEVPQTSSIWFKTAPDLRGGSDDPTDPTSLPLIPYTIASTNVSNLGYTFATYSDAVGVRPLDPETEYAGELPDGEETLQNVRLIDAGDSATRTFTLTEPLTVINSLLLDDSCPENAQTGLGGILLDAESPVTLRIHSGMLYSRQLATKTVTAADAHTISANITLDFDGNEGMILSRQTQQSSSTSSGPLHLYGPIVNDGGNGVTFAAVQNRGLIYRYGHPDTAYTGPTRLINGNLRLLRKTNSDPLNCCIPGDLEIYGGTCQNTGNMIPDEADIYLLGGNLLQKGGASNSGSGATETFRDLYIRHPNSSMTSGASGTSSGNTTMRNAYVSAGKWGITRGHKPTLEKLVLSGGTVNIESDESGSRTTIVTIQGGIVITNTPAEVYTPITFGKGSSDSKIGALMRLNGGVTFVGTANTNTVAITNPAPEPNSQWAHIQLQGEQLFDIEKGPALIDLRIEPWLQDASSDLPGGIRKVGAGTLALVHTNNAYTAGTYVEEGKLIADGRLSGEVHVAAGATFQGGLPSDTGALVLGGNLVLDSNAHLAVTCLSDSTPAQTILVGTILSEGTTLVDVEASDLDVFAEGKTFLTASSPIQGNFRASNPKLMISTAEGRTQLQIRLNTGTLIRLR